MLNKIFRSILAIGLTLLFIIPPNLIAKNTPTPQDFFKSVQNRNEKNYPESLSGRLKSTVISFQFKNIPADAIEIGKQPKLYLKFKKSHSPILVTENVSPFYANFFTPYEIMIQKSGLFFGIDNYKSYKIFNAEYVIKIKSITEGYKVSVREREGLSGDYAEYYFYSDYKIFKAYFYEQKKRTAEIKFFYQKIEDNTLPKRLIIQLLNRKQGGMKEFFVDFVKFKFDPLSDNLF